MEFILKSSKTNKDSKTVSIPKKTVEEIIDILSNVECTCVWSARDNQYIKVNDVPSEIVEELNMLTKFY